MMICGNFLNYLIFFFSEIRLSWKRHDVATYSMEMCCPSLSSTLTIFFHAARFFSPFGWMTTDPLNFMIPLFLPPIPLSYPVSCGACLSLSLGNLFLSPLSLHFCYCLYVCVSNKLAKYSIFIFFDFYLRDSSSPSDSSSPPSKPYPCTHLLKKETGKGGNVERERLYIEAERLQSWKGWKGRGKPSRE